MTKSAFWNSVRKALTINPKVSTGMPDPKEFRFIAPGGQPKAFVPSDPLADDIAQNPYYGRDFRRNYPRLSVYTQEEVAGLIAAKESLAIGSGESAITKAEDLSLTEVIKNAKTPLYTTANLPPVPTIRSRKWIRSPDQPPVPSGKYSLLFLFCGSGTTEHYQHQLSARSPIYKGSMVHQLQYCTPLFSAFFSFITMHRIHFTPLLAAVALLALTTAAPSLSHLLSDQDLSALAPPDLSTLSAPTVAPVAAPIAPVVGPIAPVVGPIAPVVGPIAPVAAPIAPVAATAAPASSQVVPPQDISVGSETGVFPVTGVYPSLIYRPAIQLYDPLVSFQSSDDGSSDFDIYGGYGDYGSYGGYGGYGGYGFGGYPYDASTYIANGPAGVINKRQVPTGPSGQPSG
ncbi:hypothetical protein BGX20_003194, partial [Mortierella sp. AD010]